MAGRLARETGVYQTPEWATLRRRVFDRDGWRCVRCRRPGRLECHHVKAVADGGNHEIGNLETLCRGCHIGETRRQNTKPRDPAWGALLRREVQC